MRKRNFSTEEKVLVGAILGENVPPAESQEKLKKDVDALLSRVLTYREREIIKLRCVFLRDHSYTWEEIGRIFKVSRRGARKIGAKAFQKLRDAFGEQSEEAAS